MDDGTAGGELHRESGIVLVVDDRTGIAPQPSPAGDDGAKLMHVLAPDQPPLNRIDELHLPIGGDAVPIVDDNVARARKGLLVDLASHVEEVRIGYRDNHLAGLEPVAVEHWL